MVTSVGDRDVVGCAGQPAWLSFWFTRPASIPRRLTRRVVASWPRARAVRSAGDWGLASSSTFYFGSNANLPALPRPERGRHNPDHGRADAGRAERCAVFDGARRGPVASLADRRVGCLSSSGLLVVISIGLVLAPWGCGGVRFPAGGFSSAHGIHRGADAFPAARGRPAGDVHRLSAGIFTIQTRRVRHSPDRGRAVGRTGVAPPRLCRDPVRCA